MTKITYLDDHNQQISGEPRRNWSAFIVLLLIFSFIMGLAGGLGTLLIFSSSPKLKDKLGINLEAINLNQTKTEKLVLEESSAVINATKKVSPAVVSINTSKNVTDYFYGTYTQQGGGTGFIITNDGLIVTNKHVAQAGDSLKAVTTDGKTYDAKIVATDPTNDLAILKIEASGLPVVELGDSNGLQIGQWVLAVGNALGQLDNTVTVGVISARERQLTASGDSGQSEQLNNLLQTDAAINPGNSGGPLVNLAGQVVGINTAVAGNAQGIGFAIPANQIKMDIDSYQKNGKIIKSTLGVRYVMLNKDIAQKLNINLTSGALIAAQSNQAAVIADSAAAHAGLKNNDIILQINGDKVDEKHSLGSLIAQYLPNSQVEIKYNREGKDYTILVKLGSTE